MSYSKDFFDTVKNYITEVKDSQKQPILDAAKMMGDCMDNNGIVQLFGLDNGVAFSMELGYRAGGLMPFHQIKTSDLALRGKISEDVLKSPEFNMNTEMAHTLLGLYNIYDEDMAILISFAANEPIIVEAAMMFKEKGQKVIAVVNKKMADAAKPLHPSNKKLTDLADLVIDVTGPNPDTVVSIDDTTKINQVSTICGNVIAQMITAECYRYLTESGKDCPVLLSANVKGADVHNREISDKYLGRWNS